MKTNLQHSIEPVSRKKPWYKRLSAQKQLLWMSIPILIYKIIFSYVPLTGWLMAFQNYKPNKGILGSEWVGFDQFIFLFKDANFIRDIRNTLGMSVINLVLGFVTAIFFAILLNEIKNLPCKKIIQNISYLPHFLSWVIVASMVSSVLSTENGIINEILMFIGIIDKPIAFLSVPKYFWGIVGAANVWKEMGWNTIIYLAAMSAIDPALYEAASVDGAGRFRKILHITLPSIKSTFIILLIMNLGHILEAGFEIQYLLGNGLVVDYSETIDIFTLKYGIQMNNYSLGTAAGIFKSLVSVILVFSANKIAAKMGEEQLM